MNINDRTESKWAWASVMLTSLVAVVASALFTKRIVNTLIYILRWLPIAWLVVSAFDRVILNRLYSFQPSQVFKRQEQRGLEIIQIVLMIVGGLFEVLLRLLLITVLLLFLVWLSKVIRWRYPLAIFLDFRLDSWRIENAASHLFDDLVWWYTRSGKPAETTALFCLGLAAASILGYGYLGARIGRTFKKLTQQLNNVPRKLEATIASVVRAIQRERFDKAFKELQRAQNLIDDNTGELADLRIEVAVTWALYYYRGGPELEPNDMWRKIARAQRLDPRHARLNALINQIRDGQESN